MFSGRCDGGRFVELYFEREQVRGCDSCVLCVQDDEGIRSCQVLDGLEPPLRCPGLVEFVRYHDVKLTGQNALTMKGKKK